MLLVTTCLVTVPAPAQKWLDSLDENLFLASSNGFARVDLSGLVDLEGYAFDTPAPGLIVDDGDDAFFNPRLSLFLDARLGEHLYGFVQFRADRGFDPTDSSDWDARFDEYLVRYTPWQDARLNVQAGKFATVVGNWVKRHDSWSNPFITAPSVYERVTAASDQTIVPAPAAFLARRDIPDRKDIWVPVVWGPNYASGIAVSGSVGRFDYAVELKNASLAARPEVWDASDQDWSNPTVSGRIGFRPGAAWNFGFSASGGAYLQEAAEDAPAFPAGQDLADFRQLTLAQDFSFAHGHWQLWGEVFLTRIEIPNVGDADALSYYLEAKYKLTARCFAAVRWNQQFFADVNDGSGGETPWDRDLWRVDAALGYRLTRHLQGKVQYSYNQEADDSPQGESLPALQVTVKF
jgi:hypothetical protein